MIELTKKETMELLMILSRIEGALMQVECKAAVLDDLAVCAEHLACKLQ